MNRSQRGVVADETHPPMAEAIQVVDQFLHPAPVVHPNIRDILPWGSYVVEHHRDLVAVQLVNQFSVHFRNDRRQPGDSPADHQPDTRHQLFGAVVGIGHDDFIAFGVSAGFYRLVDIEEEWVFNIGDDHSDTAALASGQAAGVQVRMIFELLDCSHYTRPRRAFYEGGIIQHPGNGCSGDFGAPCDLFEIHGFLHLSGDSAKNKPSQTNRVKFGKRLHARDKPVLGRAGSRENNACVAKVIAVVLESSSMLCKRFQIYSSDILGSYSMRLRLLINACVLAGLWFAGLGRTQDANALKLWYRQPAAQWTRALPIGNGRLAAMVFGDIHKEHLQINEDTVWSGDRHDRSNPEASKSVPEIRRLLQEGHPAAAQALADKTMISVPRALPVYQTLGDLWLDFGAGPDPADYRRELDLDTGVASVRYTAGGVRYTREAFASAPCHCIVVRLTADKPGSLSFHASMNRPADAATEAAPGKLIMTGQALPKRAPGEPNTGVRFRAEMKATVSGGRMENARDGLDVTAADSVTLILVAATDYREKDLAAACARDLSQSARSCTKSCA